MRFILEDIIDNYEMIADLGSGTSLSYWYGLLGPYQKVDTFDLYFTPPNIPSQNVNFYRYDVLDLYNNNNFKDKYDLAVADHIFEHVTDPDLLAESINYILKEDGHVHIGIPDASNFTDIFYHLIHKNGGGHIQKFTKDSFINLMEKHGFSLLDCAPWPDDWLWLEKCFDITYNGIKYVTQEEIKYVSNVFRKELTLDKGYFYGWEMLFCKNK